VPGMLIASADADLVLGSRYVRGGGVEGWPPSRKLISRGGCLYARLMLGVPIRDLTGGFKCFRRWVLESLDLSHVRAGGYAFQIELTYRTLRMGGRVVELPSTFSDRTLGNSKMCRSIVIEAVRQVPALRLQAARGRLVEGQMVDERPLPSL
jgi:dolichol-phosphate mannosyltransferase